MRPRPDGYIRTSLTGADGKIKSKLVHVLVALAFVPHPGGDRAASHINGIRHDNRAENLKWLTQKEACNKEKAGSARVSDKQREVLQTSADGNTRIWTGVKVAAKTLGWSRNMITDACKGRRSSFRDCTWSYTDEVDLPGEAWRPVPGKRISVSSAGRVQGPTGHRSFGAISAQGYMISNGSFVHRLVCLAFHPVVDGNHVVNHKDGDKKNNKASNLEWSNPVANRIHAAETLPRKQTPGRVVHQCTLDGEFIAEFASGAEASRKTGVSAGNICMVCRGERPHAGGFKWKHAEEE